MNLQVFQTRYALPLAALSGLIEEAIALPDHRRHLLDRLEMIKTLLELTTEADLVQHSIFLRPIGNLDEAKELFRYLHQHGLTFHPEDDPADLATPIFTADEARELRHRMREAYEFDWQEYDDPCGFCLSLSAEP